jgi:hypothetical protein
MPSMIDFDVTEDDWIAFQQFTDTGDISVSTTAVTITAITEEYVSFLRALGFMDCQIEDSLHDAIEEIRKRRKVDAKDYLMTSKSNEASLSDIDNSTEDQTKESTGTNPVNDWLE